MSDWLTISSPSRELVELLAPIPGVQFGAFKGTAVSSVTLHRSVWPLLPREETKRGWPNGITPIPLNVSLTHLRHYQLDDLPFMHDRKSSILGYEMRLGKTATTATVHNPVNGPLLVTGPLIARDVWSTWIENVHGFRPVCLESRDDVALLGFPAYFCHFDILDAHSGFLQSQEWGTLIIDEIHLMQARRSQRMSAMSLIAAKAKKIIGLSGTPMWSDPRSMWPILNLLAPSAWGSEFDFCQRYMNATQTPYGWKYSGVNNQAEFTARLREVVRRRTWQDVAPELPPTVNVVEAVPIGATERNKLELVAEKARLANHKSKSTAAAAIAGLRKRYGFYKVKRACELAEQALADGHKVVLWTWHVEVAQELADKCKSLQLTAEQSQDLRAEIIRTFQGAGAPLALIAPLAVGGVAIDLSSADVNIFVEVDWIPATNYQASMRVFKPGRPHSNVWLFLDVPVERRLLEVLGANEGCQTAAGLGYDEIANKVLNG